MSNPFKDAYENELDRYKESDTQLRIQINTLKGVVSEMKAQMTEMTSDEEQGV